MISSPLSRFRGWLASLLAIATLPLAATARAEIGHPWIVRYGDAPLNMSSPPSVIAQAPDGTMLFGGDRLLSFDGERWARFAVGNGYGICALEATPDGRIWTAAIGELGWFESSGGQFRYHSLVPHLPKEHADFGVPWHVFADAAGAVFVTDHHVMRWDGTAFHIWPLPGGRHLRGFRVGEEIFIQHRPTGLHRVGPHGPELVLPAAVLGEAGIFLIERNAANWVFFTSAGIHEWTAGEYRRVENPASTYLATHRLTAVVRLRDGGLAIATVEDGIALASPQGRILREIGPASGLPERYITALFPDRDGSLWATAQSAIFRFTPDERTVVFDQRSNFSPQEVRKIQTIGGRIGLLTNDALYELAADQRNFTRLALPGAPFGDLQSDADRVLLAGYKGITAVRGAEQTLLHAASSSAYLLAPRRSGGFFFAEGRSLFSLSAEGRVARLIETLPDFATSVIEDPRGELWIGTLFRGLLHAHPQGAKLTLDPVTLPDAAGPNGGRADVRALADGTVVAITDSGAWAREMGGTGFAAVLGYPVAENRIVARELDRQDRLWTVNGATPLRAPVVGWVARADGRVRWTPHAVEALRSVGLPNYIFPEKTTDGQTALWIAGNTGLLRTQVLNGAPVPRPPAPLVRATARSDPATAPQDLAGPLPYDTSAIQFEFALPVFARRDLIRIESRIDGIDHGWIPAPADARRELTALRNGHYRLQVRAVAETGIASESTTLDFTVSPPWWRTLSATVVAGTLLLLATYGIYRLRLRALEHQTGVLEQKVRQRTAQLETANAAKTQFVANMSHDIRNPLNGIAGMALALEDTKLDRTQAELVSNLRECTAYLSALVDDVLDFAQIEAGRIELRPTTFVPADLLRSIAATMKSEAQQSGAVITCESDPALPRHLAGDVGRIQQILVNFVSNALKYSGGTIHLAATIPIAAPDEVEFSVSDSGPGISDAEKEKLFTKFHRSAGARELQIPGTGLGLASCRLLADLMGGSVGVESEPGHGARFFVRLPLPAALPPAIPDTTQLPNATVLLVEDTDYNATATAAVLRRLGLQCERARTGAEALAMFTARPFNIVLLDRNLPDMDGTEVARRMRQLEKIGSRALLLAVTAYCTADDRRLCLEAGMDAFVGKPLTPEKLRREFLAASQAVPLAGHTTVALGTAAIATSFDLSLLQYLSDGTPAGLEQQVSRYLGSLAEVVADVVRAHSTRNWGALVTEAHRLVGQARMIRAGELAEAATRLEEAAKDGRTEQIGAVLPRALHAAANLTAAIRRRHSGALKA